MEIETALPENRTLPVLISGQTVILIGQNSNVVLTPIGAKSQEVKELYHKIRRLSAVSGSTQMQWNTLSNCGQLG